MMRVVFAGKCMWLESPVTGGDRYMVEFHRALVSKGIRVDLAREPRFPLRGRSLLPLANIWSLSMNAWYAARRKDFSASIVFQDFSSRTRLFASNRAIRGTGGAKVVSLVQGFYHCIAGSGLLRRLERKLAESYMQSLDLIIANSRSTAAEASNLGADPDRIRVVYPGLGDVFMAIRPQPRSGMGVPARILFVGGQCKPVKGLEYLISALGLLGERKFKVTLVGETSGRDFESYVQKLKGMCRDLGVEDRVEFTGLLSTNGPLIELYKNSDVFVLPSLWEGYGIAALEAMCYGVPVVASRSGGITEVVEDMETGFLVPPRNSQALAGALVRLIDDQRLWTHMSAAAAARALRIRRSWRTVGEECFRHVKELWERCAA
jgi:glycosyltransferase involved in cell wall biosynthesis